jgi:hypothetical protein
MKKTLKLPVDGFQKAMKINALLSEGWTIHPDPDGDENVIVIERADLDEATVPKSQLLLD